MSQPTTMEASVVTSATEVAQEASLVVVTASSVKTSDPSIVTASTSANKPVENVAVAGTSESASGIISNAPKENFILVVNKVDGGGTSSAGDVKLLSKPLTVLGSPTGGGTAILKKGSVGGTILKLQKAVSPQQTSPGGTKRNIVIASRPGVNQIIACAPVGQQSSQGSTPVILTQKVASGGSPVVSTIGTNASMATVGAKIVTASPANAHQRVQDVRVDNWGNYCLQRLQNMYDKGDYCDLTLRFHSSQEIKVHRVVVNLCTEYFSNLEKLYGLNDGTLILPKDVDFQTMQTIIRFFYSGKLEVRGTQFNDIYRTVKMMNITILVKLLEAHSRKPTTAAQIKKDVGRSVILKQAVDLGKGQKGQVQIQVATGQSQPSSPVIALPVAGSKSLQVAAPGMKLPPGVKTKTVLARVQPGKSPLQGQKATPKKLPIWKDRKFTPSAKTDHPPLEKWQIKEEEPARPTRFEWGDPDDIDPFLTPPPMMNHVLMEKQKEKHTTAPARKAEDIFDSVKSQNQSQSSGVKRPHSDESAGPSTVSPEPKIAKLELASASISNEEHVEAVLPDDINPCDIEADETLSKDAPSEELIVPNLHLSEDTDVEEVATSSSPSISVISNTVEKKPVPILKPALKSPLRTAKGTGAEKGKDGAPQKTVRFAPEVAGNDESDKPVSSSTLPTTATPTVSTEPTVSPPTAAAVTATTSKSMKLETTTVAATTEGGDPLVNHSKIISEVLRKFPDLVKDNKNIKLRIVQKSALDANPGTTKEGKSKVSYIVLKSTSASDATGSTSTLLKKSPSQATGSKFWETDKTAKKPNPAENTTGPWLCEKCGEGENTALQFDTYYNFRRHLVDVHGQRIDARICEYCGTKASKRNLLLYHLYTKHGVQPPKNCTFPHCDRCDYVALSESLLNKHKLNHDTTKEYCCAICNASFKSSSALASHMTANLHRNKDTKVYECPYCRKPFVRNINLKAHIRALHRDVARLEEMEDPRLPADDTLSTRIFATIGGKRRQFPSILASARNTAVAEMVEFVTADNLGDVSYVTADGQPIEILDPSSLTSLPLTLVSSSDDVQLSEVATSVETPVTVESEQPAPEGTEFVSDVGQDPQAVYVMDGGQAQAVEIDMSNMGLQLASDGSMVFEGDDQSQNFIVQDMQGNQFRRITGIDENGKPVVFLQMIGDGNQVGMAPTMLDGSMAVETSTSSSQLFVSSAGMQIPVTTSDGSEGQVIFASAPTDGSILQMVASDGGSHHLVMSEAVLAAHGQHIEEQQQHLQLVQHSQSSNEIHGAIHEQMGQPVQELHIVLDQQENRADEHEQVQQLEEQTEGMEIVEVQQPEGFEELQYSEAYTQEEIQEMEQEEANENDQDQTQESSAVGGEEETQELEIDENSQQLHIDETQQSLKQQDVDLHNQDTQVITEDGLSESIELVEGQTLTLIEEEDGTQTLKVGNDPSAEEYEALICISKIFKSNLPF